MEKDKMKTTQTQHTCYIIQEKSVYKILLLHIKSFI